MIAQLLLQGQGKEALGNSEFLVDVFERNPMVDDIKQAFENGQRMVSIRRDL